MGGAGPFDAMQSAAGEDLRPFGNVGGRINSRRLTRPCLAMVASSVKRVIATRRSATRNALRFDLGNSSHTSMPYSTTQYGTLLNFCIRRAAGANPMCAQIIKSGDQEIAAASADT